MAQFYVALYPIGGPNLDADNFFQLYLAGPLLIFLYLVWKTYSWFKRAQDRPLWIPIKDIDIYTGMRAEQAEWLNGTDDQRRASIQEMQAANKRNGIKGHLMAGVRSIF